MFGDAMEGLQEKGEETVQKAKAACCCSLFGLVLFPLSIMGLAWNEKNFVCMQQAYTAANEAFENVSCASDRPHTGDLVFLQGCMLGNAEEYTPAKSYGMGGMQVSGKDVPAYFGYSSKMTAEMYLCRESGTTKKVNGVETTEYSYSMAWSQSYFGKLDSPGDPGKKASVCGAAPNPDPPEELSRNMGDADEDHLRIATDALLGQYYLDEALIRAIPRNLNVDMTKFASSFTATANSPGPKELVPSKFAPWVDPSTGRSYITTCPVSNSVGCVRLSFQTTSATSATALGLVATTKVTKWMAPETWLCSSEGVMALVVGAVDPGTFMQTLNDQNYSQLVVLRIGLWLLSCLSVFMCLYPLFAFFDILTDYIECIPCVGDFIAGMVDNIMGCALCCFSSLVGSFFSLLTVAIAWVFVRPIVGVPLLIVALILGGVIVYWRSTMSSNGKRERDVQFDDEELSSDE